MSEPLLRERLPSNVPRPKSWCRIENPLVWSTPVRAGKAGSGLAGSLFWRRNEVWFSDNCLVATIFVLWLFMNVGLFTQGIRYVRMDFFPLDNEGPDFAVVLTYIGRGFGRTLLLNCALVVTPMTRALVHILRRSWINILMPLDDATRAHKTLGYAITVGAFGHASCLFCVYVLRWTNPDMWVGGIFGLKTTFGTGLALLATLAVIFIGSLACVRRTSNFEIFWISHHFLWHFTLFFFYTETREESQTLYTVSLLFRKYFFCIVDLRPEMQSIARNCM
jgi:hypothetical protein